MIAKLPDEVELLTLADDEKLLGYWARLRPYAQRYGDSTFQSPEVFCRRLTATDSVVGETPYGLIFLEHIRPWQRAEVHVAFWDHKLSAHADLLRECLIWAFLTYELERIETYIDSYARAVRRFIEGRMGFTHEGRLRRRYNLNGRMVDVDVFSILRDEILGGD